MPEVTLLIISAVLCIVSIVFALKKRTIKMTSLESYAEKALRTEAGSDEQMERARKALKKNIDEICHCLIKMWRCGEHLGRIKAVCFYGKSGPSKPFPFDDILTKEEIIKRISSNPRLMHGLLGVTSEMSELIEPFLGHIFYGKRLDRKNIKEEIGDGKWFENLILDEICVSWDDVFDSNIAKLKKRYPEKYTDEHALNRDLDGEREALCIK